MRFSGSVDTPFVITRGVKQGAVLSPILFNLVMDRVLSEMSNETSSLSVSNVNVGCSAHADDIRSCLIGIVNVERGANLTVIDIRNFPAFEHVKNRNRSSFTSSFTVGIYQYHGYTCGY